MRIRTIVIVTILIAILTVTIAFIASEFTQYSNPITIQNGKAMIATTNGAQAYADVEYISGNVVSVKPMAINVKTPIALPNTSAAHGAYTCQVTDDKGMTFTVTSNNVCEVK